MAAIGRNEPCFCGSGKKWKKCHGNPVTQVQLPKDVLDHFARVERCKEGTFGDLSVYVPELINELKHFDPQSVVLAVSGLAALADNHTHILRLDTLIHFAAIYAEGNQKPSPADLNRWINSYLRDSPVAPLEDPAEDVAIGSLSTTYGNRRIFNGDSSHADYYLQDLIDALFEAPSELVFLKDECSALLVVSDELAERFGYSRNTAGNPERDVIIPKASEELWRISQASVFTQDVLTTFHASTSLLAPFSESLADLKKSAPQRRLRHLRRFPLISMGDLIVAVFPASVSKAITEHVIDSLNRHAQLGAMHHVLKRVQRDRALRPTTFSLESGDAETHLLPTEGAPPARFATQGAFRFDITKHIHIVFLHDDLFSIAQNGSDEPWRPDFRDTLATFLEISAGRLASTGEYSGGMTLLVVGGIWRGIEMRMPRRFPLRWAFQVWSSADLDYLVATESRWKLMLWKLSMQEKQLADMGLRFAVNPSDTNFYSFWENNNYRLLPHEIPPQVPLGVAVGVGQIFSFRQEGRKRIDRHSIFHPDQNEWVRVCRLNPHSYFREDLEKLIYGVPSDALKGFLNGAVETDQRAWWVECRSRGTTPIQRHHLLKIWETALNWLDRIAPTIDSFVPELGAENVVVALDLTEIASRTAWELDSISTIPEMSCLPFSVSSRKLTVSVPTGFLRMLNLIENKAERLLIDAFISGSLQLAGISDGRAVQIRNSLAITDEQRFMHGFHAGDSRDHLRTFDWDNPHLLDDEEIASGALGIAQEAGMEVPCSIRGKADCNAALNQLVDAYWLRCKRHLEMLNRESLVALCLLNNERLLGELDDWRRTSRAVLSLHNDREDVLRSTQVRKTKRDRTQITSRIIIEMAVCTCPERGGQMPSEGDIDFLCGQIAYLTATAAQSDVVRSGAVAASLEISAIGEVEFGDDLNNLMFPYLTSAFEKEHMGDVDRYEEFFEVKEHGTKSEEEVFGTNFVESFRTEFGISPGGLARLGVLLTEDAVDKQAVVISRSRESLVDFMRENEYSHDEIQGFMTTFLLVPRKRWDAVAKPFRGKDWWPWRFRRRLSLMARPIVALNDAELVYAPGFCEDSFRHVVMNCYQGGFETEYFDSSRMKEYTGRENARRGAAFNQAVAEIFSSMGWSIRTEVQMSELETPESAASGDIDVLAWKGDEVCICECKELLFARTISEVSEQLSRFRGKTGDDLFKHLRRAEWVRANPQCLRRIVESRAPQIRSLLVTSKIVPMEFVSGLNVEVINADRLPSAI